ncbi:chalcone synthase 3-like [Rhodamnia argentea]|uniref:Chalcone synthase 3-like n=1 Tax=Rhodamnia argentea TaxID=178133 RepID=A0A8B8PIZ8_9MYRT|nr:chalcone synthase 3-like [Rhodamnia argentea]
MEKSCECKVPAAILAIGTANPSNCVNQEDYPDFLFRVTNTQHLTNVKKKFVRICEKSAIKKRYFHLNEEILKQNPALCSNGAESLNRRQDLTIDMIPKLGMEAATKAIEEWGQPKSMITHLVFCSFSGVDMPGADLKLLKILGLRPSVNRVMFYSLGCYAGGTILRIAKDIAENNLGARVLVVSAETTILTFRAPFEGDPVYLLSNAIFADGAAAMIVGAASPHGTTERPIFQIISASQSVLPDSDGMIEGHYGLGATMQVSEKVPELISANLEGNLIEAFGSINVADWNSIFWAPHPGGRRILDYVEEKLGLDKERLRASRHVLEEFGNMFSASVIFVLDEIRKKSIQEGKSTTGEGMELGVLLGFGAGITIETVVLRSMSIVDG